LNGLRQVVRYIERSTITGTLLRDVITADTSVVARFLSS
jgi:hypothetical protein